MAETSASTKEQSPKKPQDREPKAKSPAQVERENQKRQQDSINRLMTSGVNFDPFVLDVGDGVKWNFSPDPMPAQTERLSSAMTALGDPGEGGLQAAFNELSEALRDVLMDDDQRKQFPLPRYGSNSIMYFALHVVTGRDGFPTE